MLAPRYPGLSLRVVATDVDGQLLARARAGRYRRSSLREVPNEWRDAAFTRCGELYVVSPALRSAVEFHQQDMREALPAGPFELILCRYVAFTYFEAILNRRTLERLLALLRPGGALVIGLKEQLPAGVPGVETWVPDLCTTTWTRCPSSAVSPDPRLEAGRSSSRWTFTSRDG